MGLIKESEKFDSGELFVELLGAERDVEEVVNEREKSRCLVGRRVERIIMDGCVTERTLTVNGEG